jgi:hypothetical protein
VKFATLMPFSAAVAVCAIIAGPAVAQLSHDFDSYEGASWYLAHACAKPFDWLSRLIVSDDLNRQICDAERMVVKKHLHQKLDEKQKQEKGA